MEVSGQAVSYHLKKSLENGDWGQIEEICTENEKILTDAEKTYWIRSKYMLGAFEECYDLCSIFTEKREIKPSIEVCRFMLRSAKKIQDDTKLSLSLEFYSEHFPEDLELQKQIIRHHYSQNDFVACLDSCNSVIALESNNLVAIRYRARSLTKLAENTPLIIDSWNELLTILDNDLEALNNIARCHISELKLEKASEIISLLMKLDSDYGPTQTTMAKFVSANGGEEEGEISSGFRTLYARGEYSELIESLGGLRSWKKWKEEEAVFIFRSLLKQKHFKKAINLYKKPSQPFQQYHRIVSEVATAYRESGDATGLKETMLNLRKLSSHNSDASKHYLRHLLYFEKKDDVVASEIERMIQEHGKSIQFTSVRFILKSGRYNLIEKSGISSSISDLLDPIHGSLARQNAGDFSILWEELDHKFSHALSSSEPNDSPSSFHDEMVSSGVFYPTMKNEIFSKLLKFPEDSESLFDFEEICQTVSKNAYYFDSKSANSDLAIFCSSNSGRIPFESDFSRVIRLSTDMTKQGVIVSQFAMSLETEKLISERLFLEDPRKNLGRFYSTIQQLGPFYPMIISSMMKIISEHYPSEVWYDDGSNIAKLVAIILGYPAERIRHFYG